MRLRSWSRAIRTIPKSPTRPPRSSMLALWGQPRPNPCGYTGATLDRWAHRARQWASGGLADGLDTFGGVQPKVTGRDVFLYVISGFKKLNPAAAMALIDRLGNR